MKKLITGSVILALALTGAPQAAAFSSGSSSSPGIQQPAPEPSNPAPSVDEVITALSLGYHTAMKNQGYQRSDSATNLMRDYARMPAETRPYWADRFAAEGWILQVNTHPTADFREVYRELMATPEQPFQYALYGLHVSYGRDVTTVYILKTA